jgi:hypothetical protein
VSLIIPPGYASAAFILTGAVGTQPYVTTMGLDISGAGGDFVGVANVAFNAYALKIMPETTSGLTLDRVTLSVGQDGPGGSVDSSAAPVAGGASGTYPPTALSVIGRKVTNSLGRRGRGRMFVPGVITETHVDQDGTIGGNRRDQLNIVFGDFLTQLEAGSPGAEPEPIPVPPVLLHGSAPLTPTPITGMICSDLVGWIRGRIR